MTDQPNGIPEAAESPTYRVATDDEETWTNPLTPREFDKRIRIQCPDGAVLNTNIGFEDGEPLRNVLRAVISLESPSARGPDGKRPDGLAYVFVSQFHNEIGRVVYGYAKALVGGDWPPCQVPDVPARGQTL